MIPKYCFRAAKPIEVHCILFVVALELTTICGLWLIESFSELPVNLRKLSVPKAPHADRIAELYNVLEKKVHFTQVTFTHSRVQFNEAFLVKIPDIYIDGSPALLRIYRYVSNTNDA